MVNNLLKRVDSVYVLIVSPLKSIMKENVMEMEELRFLPSAVLSTKEDLLLPIGETKYKLVFCEARLGLLEAKFQNMLKNSDSSLHDCVTPSVTRSR